jgi:hypothetical protein
MMEAAWWPVAAGARPEWMEPWVEPFARMIDAAKKYVVSSTLHRVDWNAELVRGDLGEAVQQLKGESGSSVRGRWCCGMSRSTQRANNSFKPTRRSASSFFASRVPAHR